MYRLIEMRLKVFPLHMQHQLPLLLFFTWQIKTSHSPSPPTNTPLVTVLFQFITICPFLSEVIIYLGYSDRNFTYQNLLFLLPHTKRVLIEHGLFPGHRLFVRNHVLDPVNFHYSPEHVEIPLQVLVHLRQEKLGGRRKIRIVHKFRTFHARVILNIAPEVDFDDVPFANAYYLTRIRSVFKSVFVQMLDYFVDSADGSYFEPCVKRIIRSK